MNDKTHNRGAVVFKSKRNKRIAFVGLCVRACKIPVLLLLLGFGGLGASASIFNLPPMVQTIGLTLAVLSIVLGVIFFGYRAYRRVNG